MLKSFLNRFQFKLCQQPDGIYVLIPALAIILYRASSYFDGRVWITLHFLRWWVQVRIATTNRIDDEITLTQEIK